MERGKEEKEKNDSPISKKKKNTDISICLKICFFDCINTDH